MKHCPWWTEAKISQREISQCLKASTMFCHVGSPECSSKDVNASVPLILRPAFCIFIALATFFGKWLLLQVVKQVSWKPNKYDAEWISFFPLPLRSSFCFDHTVPWHIHRQLLNSTRSGHSLIGAVNRKSKQKTLFVSELTMHQNLVFSARTSEFTCCLM